MDSIDAHKRRVLDLLRDDESEDSSLDASSDVPEIPLDVFDRLKKQIANRVWVGDCLCWIEETPVGTYCIRGLDEDRCKIVAATVSIPGGLRRQYLLEPIARREKNERSFVNEHYIVGLRGDAAMQQFRTIKWMVEPADQEVPGRTPTTIHTARKSVSDGDSQAKRVPSAGTRESGRSSH